jgi:hypothetical protein
MTAQKQATFRIWRGDGRGSTAITTGVSGKVVRAVNHIQATQADDLAEELRVASGGSIQRS